MIDRALQPPALRARSLDSWVVDVGYRLGWLAIGAPRRRRLIDLWSAALVAFVAVLVLFADIQFALLAFVTVPFIALANIGWRRTFWCSFAIGACAASTLAASVPVANTAVRLPLVIADVCVVLALAQAFQREAREAELRRELTAEAHHRVKNSLQGVADMLYLARGDADGLERAAARVRSIAAVHDLLARDGAEAIAVDRLLQRVAADHDDAVQLELQPLSLPVEHAQRVGIVVSELLTNASRHGRAPVTLTLAGGDAVRLTVEDAGPRDDAAPPGIGLRLVRHVVEYGLGGTLELASDERGTRVQVDFPRTPCAS
jgi:two-component sensor histidine kinase